MKKTLFYAILAMCIAGCSSDDTSSSVNNQEPIIGDDNDTVQTYKLFLYSNNIPKEHLTFKTKTGNEQWVEHSLVQNRFPVKIGDSVHVSSGEHHRPGQSTNVFLEMNTVVDWHDERNKVFHVYTYDRPLNKKFLVEY